VILVTFGASTGMDDPRVAANLPTPPARVVPPGFADPRNGMAYAHVTNRMGGVTGDPRDPAPRNAIPRGSNGMLVGGFSPPAPLTGTAGRHSFG
jgi:hypothetical protein